MIPFQNIFELHFLTSINYRIKYLNMSEEELAKKLEKRYGIIFPKGYIHFALAFNKLDKNLKGLQTHHVCPRCCGGGNEDENLVRITFHHHRKLHQLILQTKELTDEQRQKLTFAYQKMKKG